MNTTDKLPVPKTPAEMMEQLTTTVWKQSGGEDLELIAEYTRLRDLIQKQDDVVRVLALHQLPNGWWLYMIQTPFISFPKFVIGETDADNKDVSLVFRSAARWSAEDQWDNILKDWEEQHS